MASNFEITETKDRFNTDTIIFTVKGKVNAETADKLQAKLDQAINKSYKYITLNMRMVDLLLSAGIRVLLATYKKSKTLGITFRIEAPSEQVRNTLGMVALDELLIK